MTSVDTQSASEVDRPDDKRDRRRRAFRRATSAGLGLAVAAATVAAILGPESFAAILTPDRAAASDPVAGKPPESPANSPAAAIQEIAADGPLFGIYTPGGPTGADEIAAAEAAAGASAGIVKYFADATHPLDVSLLDAAASGGAIPMLSLETHNWATSDIAAGAYDAEIENLAGKLSQFNNGEGGTVLIRLNHEMNGNWYPWSEGRQGNPTGAYAASWQRIVDIVREQGTGRTTVLWVWSANILRGADLDTMVAAYPGDEYVDYIGLTGYGATWYERSAAQTFDETIDAIRADISATKPLMITESGASPGKYQVAWTRSLGSWLTANPDVHAFVWFDADPSSGASNDWRFTPYPAVAEALRASLVEARQSVAGP